MLIVKTEASLVMAIVEVRSSDGGRDGMNMVRAPVLADI